MSEYLIYLAGPILGTSYGIATDWRNFVRQKLPAEYICLSPMRGKEYLKNEAVITKSLHGGHPLSTPRGINTRDRNDVIRADLVLVNFIGAENISIGTCIELGWADMLRKPIIIAMEDTNVHYHKMVRDIAGYIFPTLEEAANMVVTVLSP